MYLINYPIGNLRPFQPNRYNSISQRWAVEALYPHQEEQGNHLERKEEKEEKKEEKVEEKSGDERKLKR